MIKEKKITKTVTITERTYTCDDCGKSTRSSSNYYRKCEMCKGLFCRNCLIMYDWDILEPNDFHGDYPDYMCKKCWSKGANYMHQIKTIKEEADKKTEELMNLWKKDCVT